MTVALALVAVAVATAGGGGERRVIAGAGEQRSPPTDESPPPGWRLSARDAIELAGAQGAVRRAVDEFPGARPRAFLKADRHWQVSYVARSASDRREVAQVLIRDSDRRVVEAWTGFRVAWTMARGYPGAFGQAANSPWVWVGMSALFLLPFLRPPLRMLHLDLMVLLSFSVSYALFTAGRVEDSVPLAIPPLVYLLARMLALARSRSADGGGDAGPRLALTLSTRSLLVGVGALLVFRLGLNISTSTVIDAGYAGVIGADRLLSDAALYGTFPPENSRGDTYGPVNYYAYVPWELLLPWSGTWDELPAAHAAAVAFDVAATAVLWRLGRAFRGPRLGALLAFLWCAYPFTLLTLNTNANDSLTAALAGLLLLSLARPTWRGGALALAGLAKFVPLALGPLAAASPATLRPGAFETEKPGSAARRFALTCAGFTAASVLLMLPVVLIDGLAVPYERTLGFQSGRDSPFSAWGLYDLRAGQSLAALAALVLALVVAWIPRRRDAVVVCALAAAVLIAVELALGHWFYTYIVWFLPPLWLALLAPYREPDAEMADRPTRSGQAAGRNTDSIESARPGSGARTSTALSHGSSSEGS